MADPRYLLTGILVAGAVTWALRAVPFALLAPLRDSVLVTYLGERMPVGIMLILAVYTVHGVVAEDWRSLGPTCLALAVTVGLHLWRRNLLLSIFAGTVVNVVLQSLLVART
ncbi:branched-chain amino acid transporter permease [Myceligenerans indicum]|uniref:Branched-chain amino acid ABC transporter n=1 Tax=Myceligenerans indicum TaxID=2593663 RepID=A0ABS1LGB5_9MICO|nr:AzlD domain-containing protein [Myceligenerans indicum]MBL0885199.1 branched-chain amino acid ABC transporter [Myceligenerans indicum]